MITALDHVALIVPDLDAAAQRYTQLLGCAPNWHGADGGAAHVWFQLDNMALDIIAPVGPGFTGDQAKAHLDKHGEGIWAIAYATPDLDAAHKLMERRGMKATAPHPLRSTHVQTKEKRLWRMYSTALAGVTTFMIEQKPEDAPWPRCEATTPSGVTGLDHVVVRTPAPERAQALYGAQLGLDMRLDRTAPEWGTRLMFFRCGDLIVEIAHDLKAGVSEGDDALWGFTWRSADIDAAHARLTGEEFNISEIRTGRRPGTRVFTVRDGTSGVPTLMIGP
jgi:catechol 2,3-dioxygenase-like lactoylglutathione lyase family enzyme